MGGQAQVQTGVGAARPPELVLEPGLRSQLAGACALAGTGAEGRPVHQPLRVPVVRHHHLKPVAQTEVSVAAPNPA